MHGSTSPEERAESGSRGSAPAGGAGGGRPLLARATSAWPCRWERTAAQRSALNRLKCWVLNAASCTAIDATYDKIGNLLTKTGVGTYAYGANGNGTGAGPHQARTVAGGAYSYDANGNLTSGGSRTYTWDGGNLLSSVNGSEFSLYDADGERVLRRAGGATTVYFQGLWENIVGGATRRYYSMGGQPIGVRDSGTGLSYLHSDHLGSASLATHATNTTLLSQQEFTPWGSVRTGSLPQTTLSFTGQRLDSTGLLYYHARYYDPVLARFVSADTVVPGAGSLTITPSDATAAPLFQQGSKDKDGKPIAPADPKELNRYSYVNNNPVRYTDPTGHCAGPAILVCAGAGALAYVLAGGGTIATNRANAAALRGSSLTLPSPEELVESSMPLGKMTMPMMELASGLLTEVLKDGITEAVDTLGTIFTAKQSKRSQKERKTDTPSWAKGEKPLPGETPAETAERLLNGQYGEGNWKEGPSSEYNKLKKYYEQLLRDTKKQQ